MFPTAEPLSVIKRLIYTALSQAGEIDAYSRQQGRFRLVGECYIQGVMDGQIIELVDRGIFRETEMYLV